MVGKAERVAQIVPTAKPFVSALWAALTGALKAIEAGKPEVPPGQIPTQRFTTAAAWFQALLEPESSGSARAQLQSAARSSTVVVLKSVAIASMTPGTTFALTCQG